MTDLKNYIHVSFIGLHHIRGKSKPRLSRAEELRASRSPSIYRSERTKKAISGLNAPLP